MRDRVQMEDRCLPAGWEDRAELVGLTSEERDQLLQVRARLANRLPDLLDRVCADLGERAGAGPGAEEMKAARRAKAAAMEWFLALTVSAAAPAPGRWIARWPWNVRICAALGREIMREAAQLLRAEPARGADLVGGLLKAAGVSLWIGAETFGEDVRQAQKMEAVGRLAGGIAHDFNNYLTVITGYCSIALRRLGGDSPLRKEVDEIRKAADRAVSLTRQLLAFSRRQVLTPKVLDLNAVVVGLRDFLQRLIGEHIELSLVPRAGKRLVKVDRGQIEQVIVNLATNARDAMPQGGRLTIETAEVVMEEEDDNVPDEVPRGTYILLAVGDTGCGMDSKLRSRIFEPFVTTKELGRGTGLGLSMVYGIVKQNGGRIDVQSAPGVGSTFKVYLPRAAEPEEPPEPSPTVRQRPPASETILVVEDQEEVRALTLQMLADDGYKLLEATDGREALERVAQHPGRIDLVLTDVVMPRMDGPELARLLVRRPGGPKILLMSGYTSESLGPEGLWKAGMPFLHKPFTVEELLQGVRDVLGPGRGSP